MKDVDNGAKPIQRLPMSRIGATETAESRPTLLSAGEVILQSTSLIDDSAKHLFGLMKNLSSNCADDAKVACDLAKQIQGLARVKLDYIKALK